MKLLLTSAGFTNDKIVQALADLVILPFTKLNLAFIPTAANVEKGDKSWLIEDLNNCKKLGFPQIDIVDISALPPKTIVSRLMESNIIFVGGGNTLHLMNWIKQSGLDNELPKLLETRVYVGLSAGSMIVGKWWSGILDKEYYDEPDTEGSYSCLNYVNFHIMPHFGSDMFPKVNQANMKVLADQLQETIYLLDDNSAVKVNDGSVEIISDGNWDKLN